MTGKCKTHSETVATNLGDLISALYEESLILYGDEDKAALATATTVNEILGTLSQNHTGPTPRT